MTIAMVAGAPPLALAGPASRLRTINAALASLGAAVMNSAPQGTDKTITTWEDMRYTFTRADFGFSDVDGDVLQAVRIASLPTAGVLTTAGRVMLAGDLVSAADIDALQLVFTPAANANGAGYASFTFQVQDDGGTAGGGADFDPSANTITVDVIATNDAPTGTNTTITTGEDTAHTFTRADFGFGDIDGDSLQAVRVTTLPVAGVLTLGGVAISAGDAVSAMDIDASRLAFAPPADANGAGFARIDFRVEDTGGTANGGSDVDATANTVTVDVTPVNDAPMGLDRTITANEDASYTFTSADFAFSDVEGDSLQAVRIATLPWVGMLTLDGVGVAAGELVSASAIDAFQLTFTPAANGHGAGYANFAFQVQDAGGTADGGANLDASASTITVDVTSISDAPAGTDRTVSTSEGTAYVFTRADFVFSDVDGDALQAVRITTLPWPGILTVGGMEVNAGDMVFAPDIDAGGLVYTPGSAAGRADYASFTFQVMDDGSTAGGGADIDPSANTMTVRITAVNDAPVVTTSGGTTVFTENGSPLVVDGGLTVDDVDNATLASATVMVAGNFRSGQDVLAFTNDGSTMGNIAASYNASTGILTLVSAGSTATLAQWQAALRSVSYADFSENPDTSTRTISFTVNDGAANSVAAGRTLAVVAVNDAPVITTSGGTSTVTEGGSGQVDGGLVLVDVDNATLATATVALVANFQSGEDLLAFTNDGSTMGNIAASYNAATGTLTLTSSGATATVAQWQAALRSVSYADSSQDPATATRTVAFSANDGNANSAAAPRSVTVTAVNDAPVVATSGGTTVFTENGSPLVVDGGLTVDDVDNATLASATVMVAGNFRSGQDVLTFTNDGSTMGNIAASYNASTGILTLVSAGSTATLAQWQAALRSVSYADFSENPDTSTRTISFTVNDRAANSVAAGRTLAVVAVNDAPVITTSGGITNYTGGSAAVTIDAGVTVSDVDNSTQSSATVAIGSGFHSGDSLGFTNTSAATYGNIAASYNAATGVLTMTSSGATATNAQWAGALSSVTFASTSTSYGARTVAFVVADGASSSAAATDTIAMSGVPTVTNVGSATPDGRYKIGDTIYLTVSFDQAVTVDTAGGSPTLLLETGSVDRDAPYVSGSGSTTLTFAYSVLPGDASPDLDYATTSALALNGATIRSAGGADAVLTLPATGSATSIAGQRAIVVDGVAPTVVSVNVPANGTYGVSQNLDFTVNYGEAVTVNTGGGMPRLAITLDTGGTVHADYVSGSGTTALVFRMTVVVGERDADGITVGATLESNGASIGDAAGNDAEPALNGVGSTSAVLIDTPVADLGVDVDDGGDYARYGKIRNYLVTIVNAGDGDAIGASISSSYSPGLDAANTHWKCFGGGLASVPDVAHCEPSSGAGSVASTIDLPAGTSLGFLVSVPVTVEAADPDVQVGIAVTGSASNVSLGASDTDTLVLFRDGFDAIYADGTQMVAQPVSLATATLSPCAEETTLMGTEPPLVELSREPAEAMVDRLFDTRVSGGRQVAVERTNLGVRPWVRLVTSGADGERASAWTASDAGATLALGLADDGTSQWLLLEGRTASLRQMLPPEDASTSDACR